MNITIELTDMQYKSLEFVAVSPEEWATNVVSERARIAADKIIDITVKYCLDNNLTVPQTREKIIDFAYNKNLIQTLAEKEQEALAARD